MSRIRHILPPQETSGSSKREIIIPSNLYKSKDSLKADPIGVLTGSHYLDGNHACAEGALAAGCRFFGGYPITPSTEIAERFSLRAPFVGGLFIQMEDELGSIAAVLGAALGGKKAMTCTSGPGFSLMMENFGLALMMEVPCVVVDVQRGGPSTGLPTLPGQQEMMQVRWGSHGDYEVIALCPQSPQECFEMAVDAFNLSEIYRMPVFVMMDECVGHMTERVVIPPAEDIYVVPRNYTRKSPGDAWPYEKNGKSPAPPLLPVGEGYNFHLTGLTHDYHGYPVITPQAQDEQVRHLVGKVRDNADKIVRVEENMLDDAEVVVVAYGITARVADAAVEMARENGIKAGMLRLITAWPFPEKIVRELAGKVKAMVMPELNLGQMYRELDRCVRGACETRLVANAGGTVHAPEEIFAVIREVSR